MYEYICPTPIAILLAVYNGEKYLKVQIDSILEQTNKDWTLYIRDDASIDSTRDIIANYCDNYPNIIDVLDDLGNLGCYDNFRQLVRMVKSNYYMFSDADDYWLPQKIQVSFDFLREKECRYPNMPLLVHCDKSNADNNLNIINYSDWDTMKFNPDLISKFAYVPLYIVGGATSIFNGLIIDKYLKHSPFETAHDGWLALQVSRYGKIFAIRQSLLIYRRHNQSVTATEDRRQTLANYIRKIGNLSSTLQHHWEFASQLQTMGYGGKVKYFYYRIVVFFKIMLGRLLYKKSNDK